MLRPHDLARAQLLVRFGYDGARFHGLQPQGPTIPTAGGALKERLTAAADGTPPKGLNFAARTDAGVHALGNLATCYWRDVDEAGAERIIERLAQPRDDGLVDVRAWRVPATIHARGSGRGKRYRYLVEDQATDTDPHRPWVWGVAPTLDVGRMQLAAARLEGTHDFSSLQAADCRAASAVKTLARVRVGGPFPLSADPTGPRRFVVEVSGTAFLRKMMRNLVGLLAEVGAGLREPGDIDDILTARSRQAAGSCAPPRGLTLVEVGCAWPDDGSALIRELRNHPGLGPDDPTLVDAGVSNP